MEALRSGTMFSTERTPRTTPFLDFRKISKIFGKHPNITLELRMTTSADTGCLKNVYTV